MKIRAVCTDIDGTLLDSPRELSPRTIAAINNIKRDVPVILASSRMPGAMRHLQKEMGILDHPMICFNGGCVIYFVGESPSPVILDSVQMPLSICSTIISLAKGSNIHVSLFAEDEWYAPLYDEWTEREAMITKVSPTIIAFKDLMNTWGTAKSGAHKVMCMGPEPEIEKMCTALQSFFSMRFTLTVLNRPI